MVFAKEPRRWPLLLVALVVLAGIVTVAVYFTRPSNIDVHGTFTMFQPLRCRSAGPGDIFHTAMVFVDGEGQVIGRVTTWRGARLTTENVRGFVHCREVGSYRIRLPKATSYLIDLPSLGQRVGPVSLERLTALRFRYDVFYCCGR
jgi:hypothetical protein